MFCNFALLLLCRLPYFAMSVIIMLLFCVIFLFLPWPKVAFIAINIYLSIYYYRCEPKMKNRRYEADETKLITESDQTVK